jgi:hypothetical protein
VTQQQFEFLNRWNPEETSAGPVLFAERPSDGLLPPVFPNTGDLPSSTLAPPSHHAPPTFRPAGGVPQQDVFLPPVTAAPFVGNFGQPQNHHHAQQSSTEAPKYYTTPQPRIGQSG